MGTRMRALYQEVKASTLGRIALVVALVVPSSLWVFVTRMETDLLVRWPLTIPGTAVWLVALPLLPVVLRSGDLENLDNWQLAPAPPSFFVLAALIVAMVAVVRRWLEHSTASSVVVGYMAAIALLEMIGVAPWIVVALMFSQIGPYELQTVNHSYAEPPNNSFQPTPRLRLGAAELDR